MKFLASIFLQDPKPFSDRREIKWGAIKKISLIGIVVVVVGLLLMPAKKNEYGTFHENAQNGSMSSPRPSENDPSDETARQLNQARGNLSGVHSSLEYLYQPSKTGGSTGSGSQKNSPMILTRDGTDSRGALSAGTRVSIRLMNRVVISNQAMPVIGMITSDVVNENDVAISKGAKVLGSASFDDAGERATIDWKTIILPDGRERQFQAIGVSQDGQAGIDGKVSSNTVKNTIGETITQFIGAYAQGSMSQGAFGANEGGVSNGLKSAIAQTAKGRASSMAETMKKEKKWIELSAGTETQAVLSQSFAFKEPGAVYGR